MSYADVLDSCYYKGYVTSPKSHLPPEAILELEDQTKCLDHANLKGLCLGDILGQTADPMSMSVVLFQLLSVLMFIACITTGHHLNYMLNHVLKCLGHAELDLLLTGMGRPALSPES